MKSTLIKLAFILLIAYVARAEDMMDDEDAAEFLAERGALEMAVRSLKYTGHEQRSEAREKYEEKCARSYISRKMHKQRWCPKLDEWDEWRAATKNDKPKNKIFG